MSIRRKRLDKLIDDTVATYGTPHGQGEEKKRGGRTVRFANGRVVKFKKKYNARTVSMVTRFLEFGTSHNAAEPFMRPTFKANAEEAIIRIAYALKEALDEICEG
jgi:HK97 gp10 family phage protein